ncbi:MAG: hypothetical protein HYV63_26240 [Candidatus Schekmanbacteria bacterium]|nr:hypothetical protein [Candidatus Schekmanbacteria bacterium]
MCPPLLVSDRVEEGKLVLADGFKRLAAARELGATAALVRVSALDGVAAEVAMISANAGTRGLADLEEGFIVHSLHRTHGRSQVEIAELLGRHKSWVCRRLQMVEHLDPRVLDDLRLGLIGVTMARELVRLPRGNQADAAMAISAHGLGSRQAGRLVSVLCATADPDQRRAVLGNPLEHLPEDAAKRRERSDPRLGFYGDLWRRHLLQLGATSNRVIELFREHGVGQLSRRESKILGELGEAVLPAARTALARLQTELEVETRGGNGQQSPATARE